mmetsp:Transcript_31065/g.59961  ORF Transcript_31065/g.59961 Transcript_31065/m.59961 type:complete len:180 (+) Transcript_31065:169-708(+)|eukprot:CAMPEP_0114254802 /NCGR_PEP_ID=MMETSP0058-20121206/17199_1 /TAXON_ID=36894 /ORGANISM="Pyramimonas parkeae, CCMP726" /LENGTH=179 /DNA_ID=CAMNT_0001369097 /DNA_START=145 /DNA_END=681 /DNA_ORIENTATION=-
MSRSEADSEHDGSEHGEERDQEEATYQQPTSWEDFWKRTTEEHAEAMRAAGKDPEKPWEPGENKHGQKIVRGVPLDGTLHCFGCSAVTDHTLECCQCLEIFRDRAGRAAGDDWERAFYCSTDCYVNHWEDHKDRHGPSQSGPSRMDSRIHHFDAAKGFGALWDSNNLKRMNFVKCSPHW